MWPRGSGTESLAQFSVAAGPAPPRRTARRPRRALPISLTSSPPVSVFGLQAIARLSENDDEAVQGEVDGVFGELRSEIREKEQQIQALEECLALLSDGNDTLPQARCRAPRP